jgi:hypothetical protein
MIRWTGGSSIRWSASLGGITRDGELASSTT